MSDVFLRFADLKRRKICNNWMTLKRWIANEGFPPGVKLGPNTRAWTERELAEWLAGRRIWSGPKKESE